MAGFRGDDRATEEARRLGEALARLRREVGLNQAEAGARAGMTGQGWGLYEAGKRPGLFRPDVQRRLTAALGAEPQALTLVAASEGPSSGSTKSEPALTPPAAPPLPQVVLTDDSLDPWASAGTVIDYDPDRFPRRGQGCVVTATDGSVSVWLFDGADADRLHLRGGAGGLDASVRLDRAAVSHVAAVVARRDA